MDDLKDSHESTNMNSVCEIFDSIELKIEDLGKEAEKLIREKSDIAKTLEAFRLEMECDRQLSEADLEDIRDIGERLKNRLASIHLRIEIQRTPKQQEAISKVEKKLSSLILAVEVEGSEKSAAMELERCFNACGNTNEGRIDEKFQGMILECTSLDQKSVKKRLEGILQKVAVITKTEGQEKQDELE